LGVSGLWTPLGVDAGNRLALLDGSDLFWRCLWIVPRAGATRRALPLRQPGGGCAALLLTVSLLAPGLLAVSRHLGLLHHRLQVLHQRLRPAEQQVGQKPHRVDLRLTGLTAARSLLGGRRSGGRRC
jgi:hypothetical protein